jgi:hypothetical protein
MGRNAAATHQGKFTAVGWCCVAGVALTVFHWLTARLTGALGYTTQDVDDGYVVIDIERVL